jgi:hypothetical protein
MSAEIDKWLLMLGGLLNPIFPGEAAGALKAFKPHLQGMPARCFTLETARLVAECERFGPVPAWDVVAKVLRQHVRDTTPINSAGLLSAPRNPEYQRPGPEEIGRIAAMVASLRKPEPVPLPAQVKDLGPIHLSGEALRQARISTGIHPRDMEGATS